MGAAAAAPLRRASLLPWGRRWHGPTRRKAPAHRAERRRASSDRVGFGRKRLHRSGRLRGRRAHLCVRPRARPTPKRQRRGRRRAAVLCIPRAKGRRAARRRRDHAARAPRAPPATHPALHWARRRQAPAQQGAHLRLHRPRRRTHHHPTRDGAQAAHLALGDLLSRAPRPQRLPQRCDRRQGGRRGHPGNRLGHGRIR